MDFETEEQQLEAIKKWWKENSTMIITGVAFGVTAIFGWQYYQKQSLLHADKASIIFEQVLSDSQNPAMANDQLTRVNTLEAEFSNTPYASLSALILAKQQLATGEFSKAQQQLQWVVDNARQDELKYIAKIRLARLFLSTQQEDQALYLLGHTYPESFNAMVFELKGDVLLSQGKVDLARTEYTKALSLTANTNRWLQMKLDDIGGASENLSKADDPSA